MRVLKLIYAVFLGGLFSLPLTSIFAAGIQAGDSKEAVMKALGTPKGKITLETQETYFYENGKVEFTEGRVVSSSLLSNEQLASKQAEEQAAIRVAEDNARKSAYAEQEKINQMAVLKKNEQAKRAVDLPPEVISALESYIAQTQLDVVQAEDIRNDFMTELKERNITSSVVDVWFADPAEWRSINAGPASSDHRRLYDTDAQQPMVQSLLIALRKHEVRLASARKQKQKDEDDKFEDLMFRRIFHPQPTVVYETRIENNNVLPYQLNNIESKLDTIQRKQQFGY